MSMTTLEATYRIPVAVEAPAHRRPKRILGSFKQAPFPTGGINDAGDVVYPRSFDDLISEFTRSIVAC